MKKALKSIGFIILIFTILLVYVIVFTQHSKKFDIQPTNSLCHKNLDGREKSLPSLLYL